jgi:hypothetical protein
LLEWNTFVNGELDWSEEEAKKFHSSCHYLARPGANSLLTVVCNLGNRKGRKSLKTVALLDSCSSITLIDEEVARKLGLKKRSPKMSESINVVRSKSTFDTWQVEVPITSVDGLLSVIIIAYTMKDLTRNTGIVDWATEKVKFEHLRELPFEPLPENPTAHLLIGTDNSSLLAPEDPRKGEWGEPIALLTPLGWTCYGSSSKSKSSNTEAEFEAMFASKLLKK